MYTVRVVVEKDGVVVFVDEEKFAENQSRDSMRAFLKEIGSGIESYDIHFASDEDEPDEDDFGYQCPHGYYVNVAGCPACGVD